MNRAYGISALLLFALVVGLLPAHAQYNSSDDPITLQLNPQYPTPYSIATVRPASTLVDLSASRVTISVNGSVVEQGTGSESAQIAIGGPGTKTTVSVTVTTGGQTYKKSLTIRPGDVALVTEPLSTSHALYEGAPLIGAQSRVRLIALADLETAPGVLIPSSQLIYTWKFGDQVLQSSSGLGKSVLSATAPVRYRDADITVTVQSTDSLYVAQAATTITPIDPYVRIYQNDPLLGPEFNQALPGDVTMSDAEETFRVVPYYFSGTPSIIWTVNDAQSGTEPDLTVRSNGNGQGTAVVNVSAEKADTNQSADGSLTVRFGAAKSLGIFGL